MHVAGVLASLLAMVACGVIAVMGFAQCLGLAAAPGHALALLLLGVVGMLCCLLAAYCIACTSASE